MAYFITYLSEVSRTVQAVMIDDRANQFPPDADGNVIKPIVDALVETISENSIPYKMESLQGNLVGIFVLLVNRTDVTATLQIKIVRSQFNSIITEIDLAIANFILGGDWGFDILL